MCNHAAHLTVTLHGKRQCLDCADPVAQNSRDRYHSSNQIGR